MPGSFLTGLANVAQGYMQGKLAARQASTEMQRMAILDALQQQRTESYLKTQALQQEAIQAEAQRATRGFETPKERRDREYDAWLRRQEALGLTPEQQEAKEAEAAGRMFEANLPFQIGVAERPMALSVAPEFAPGGLTAPYTPGAPALPSPPTPSGAVPSLRTSLLPGLTAPVEQLGEPVQMRPAREITRMAPTSLGLTAEATLAEKVRASQALGGRITEFGEFGYPTGIELPPTAEERELSKLEVKAQRANVKDIENSLEVFDAEWPILKKELEARGLGAQADAYEAQLESDRKRLTYEYFEENPEAFKQVVRDRIKADAALLATTIAIGSPAENIHRMVQDVTPAKDAMERFLATTETVVRHEGGRVPAPPGAPAAIAGTPTNAQWKIFNKAVGHVNEYMRGITSKGAVRRGFSTLLAQLQPYWQQMGPLAGNRDILGSLAATAVELARNHPEWLDNTPKWKTYALATKAGERPPIPTSAIPGYRTGEAPPLAARAGKQPIAQDTSFPPPLLERDVTAPIEPSLWGKLGRVWDAMTTAEQRPYRPPDEAPLTAPAKPEPDFARVVATHDGVQLGRRGVRYFHTAYPTHTPSGTGACAAGLAYVTGLPHVPQASHYIPLLQKNPAYRQLKTGAKLKADDIAIWKHYGTRKSSSGWKYGHAGLICIGADGQPALISLFNGVRGDVRRIIPGAVFFRKIK